MFNILIDSPPTEVMGQPINWDYRYMVLFEQLLMDDDVSDVDKISLALELFYQDRVTNVQEAFNQLLLFYQRGEKPEKGASSKGGGFKRLYDFDEEADLIYTSFLDGHKIRLQGIKMHWWEFRTLLFTLPEGTPMHDRILYRSLNHTDFTGNERKKVLQMQKRYALKNVKVPILTNEEKDKAYLEKMNARYAEVEKCRIAELCRQRESTK